MKTDYYLNLCLEQAAQSPLRYRHGCIIVRGGKVIGQGFNDHRAGFDGGALKTGVLPVRSLNPAAVAELKKKHKHKRDLKNPSSDATTFTPFEAMGGGGKLANTPLSMHSEMMAIHSALSASTTLVSTAVSSQKPYFKLSGDSKRKARLRRDAIKTYVETICKVALAQSTEQRFGRPGHAFHVPMEDSMEKHRGKDQKNRHHENHGHQKQQRRQCARKLSAQETLMAPGHSSLICKPAELSISDTTTITGALSHATGTNTAPMKFSKGRTGEKKRSTVDRKKHPRLNGADLYVARLGWQSSAKSGPSPCCEVLEHPHTATAKQPTGSLHEELLNPGPVSVSAANNAPIKIEPEPSVLASRPCYRCIAYMNSVGIKRVFWTTSSGEWECAKVRDLVDALDDLGSGDAAADAHTTLNSVFVTKHEVLMLRRTMGADS
ncbi:hypothetical protein P171DRAFT_444114 [Karstenula rhodostoma CBS 690.94]|uniref:CMP/dCMP-type deaminase domain-containing protein n=1 Tax=Karstenula rhodostoma CBS 690.94 TaxID=1392251 RepID=A0A9P4PL18_9PLEO|nr:hypothetical protein P171DRAFT_444114 [Karstenula rhodostoma CBS 690.94]